MQGRLRRLHSHTSKSIFTLPNPSLIHPHTHTHTAIFGQSLEKRSLTGTAPKKGITKIHKVRRGDQGERQRWRNRATVVNELKESKCQSGCVLVCDVGYQVFTSTSTVCACTQRSMCSMKKKRGEKIKHTHTHIKHLHQVHANRCARKEAATNSHIATWKVAKHTRVSRAKCIRLRSSFQHWHFKRKKWGGVFFLVFCLDEVRRVRTSFVCSSFIWTCHSHLWFIWH